MPHPNPRSLLCALPVAALLSTGAAEAAIRCDGGLQIINGQSISTPYCRDNYLAAVANQYGIGVSAQAVRSNPNVKREICVAIGHDVRVREACASDRPQGSRPWWP